MRMESLFLERKSAWAVITASDPKGNPYVVDCSVSVATSWHMGSTVHNRGRMYV